MVWFLIFSFLHCNALSFLTPCSIQCYIHFLYYNVYLSSQLKLFNEWYFLSCNVRLSKKLDIIVNQLVAPITPCVLYRTSMCLVDSVVNDCKHSGAFLICMDKEIRMSAHNIHFLIPKTLWIFCRICYKCSPNQRNNYVEWTNIAGCRHLYSLQQSIQCP